jgi:outer membrane lipoprotein-sorting protein
MTLLLAACLCGGLTGCFSTTRIVQKTQAPDLYKTATVEQLEKNVFDRDAAVKTLNAQVLITATTGGAKEGVVKEYTSFKGYIFLQKPEALRVIMLLPVYGSRAMDMVSDGKTFTLMHQTLHSGDVWIQGTNAVTKPSKSSLENLRPQVFLDSLLVPGVKPGEYVSLTESTRVVSPQTKHAEAVEEPDYDLTLSKLKGGHILERERVIHISRVTMLPFQQDIYENGQIATQALYEGYQTYASQLFPSLITIRRPQDELSLKIQVTKLTLNGDFEADQFELPIPDGVKVTHLE